MKFFHLSDLHFGKLLHGYDLVEEQRKLIQDILDMAIKELPDAILISGDIYDRSIPSALAMTLLEEFLLGIDRISEQKKQIEILVIAGNHDSAQRLSYGSAFLERHHIHIAVLPPQEETEKIQKITLQDSYGNVNFYLLPYTKPGMIRHLSQTETIQNSNDAICYLLERENIDWEQRNVLLSHQFYANAGREPEQCDSESPRLYVGGLDVVDTTVVERFDYVALGHIHSPQNLGHKHIRYCGTPLKYSVSEAGQKKSVTMVELGKKGDISYQYLPITPLRNVRSLRGTLEEIAEKSTRQEGIILENSRQEGVGPENDINEDTICHDYVSITLTDEEILDHPKEYLENYFDHILEVQIDNKRTKKILEEEIIDMQELTPLEAFRAFFSNAAGRKMTAQEEDRLQSILEEIEKEESDEA